MKFDFDYVFYCLIKTEKTTPRKKLFFYEQTTIPQMKTSHVTVVLGRDEVSIS